MRVRVLPRRAARPGRAVALAAVLLLSGLATPPVTAAGYTHSATYISSADGTPLHTEVFRPDGRRGRVPVVLLVSPYLNGGSPQRAAGTLAYRAVFTELLDRGYAIVQVSLRGYGASGGCGDFGGPGEQADAKAAVEWSAGQPWSTGRVGMWGISYDGWTQVMALAGKPRGLAAAVIQSPLVSLYRGLYMNGTHYAGGWWSTPAGYAQIDLMPPAPFTGVDGARNAVTGTAANPGCYAANNTDTANPDPKAAYWRARDLVARAQTTRVPVLWSHGFRDANTKPDNITALYPRLRGPKRAWVGQFAHRPPTSPNEPDLADRYVAEAFLWLDAYVKRDAKALRAVQAQPRAVVQQGHDGRWRDDNAWPPRDVVPATFALRSGTFTDVPSNDGRDLHAQGGVLWSFSKPLPYDVQITGAPRVSIGATGTGPAQVVVKVYDVSPDGTARMVTRGAHNGVSGMASFDLYPQDWRFAKGHRIAIAVLGNDRNWFHLAASGQVRIDDSTLTVSALRYDRNHGTYYYDDVNQPNSEFRVADDVLRSGTASFRLPPRMIRARPPR